MVAQADVEKMEVKYSNAPVKLYRTVGIKSCTSEYRHKSTGQHIAMLYEEDVDALFHTLGSEIADRVTMILITKDGHGVPMLVLLQKNNGRYCGIGTTKDNPEALQAIVKKYEKNRD